MVFKAPCCPRDQSELIIGQGDVPIEICPHCQGIWLSSGSLNAMSQKYHVNLHDLSDSSPNFLTDAPLLCPEHQLPMDSRAYGRLEIDLCRQCGGIWLDPGELEKVVAIKQKMKIAKQQAQVAYQRRYPLPPEPEESTLFLQSTGSTIMDTVLKVVIKEAIKHFLRALI